MQSRRSEVEHVRVLPVRDSAVAGAVLNRERAPFQRQLRARLNRQLVLHIARRDLSCCRVLAVPTQHAGKDGECLSGERGYGKMQLVRTFGGDLAAGTVSMGGSICRVTGRVCLSLYAGAVAVYVVKGMK